MVNSYKLKSWIFFRLSLTGGISARYMCNDGKLQSEDNRSILPEHEVQYSKLGCSKSIQETLHATTQKCGPNEKFAEIVEIGWTLYGSFKPMIQVCHDANSEHTYYAVHEVVISDTNNLKLKIINLLIFFSSSGGLFLSSTAIISALVHFRHIFSQLSREIFQYYSVQKILNYIQYFRRVEIFIGLHEPTCFTSKNLKRRTLNASVCRNISIDLETLSWTEAILLQTETSLWKNGKIHE